MHLLYGGKMWQALYLANQSNEKILVIQILGITYLRSGLEVGLMHVRMRTGRDMHV